MLNRTPPPSTTSNNKPNTSNVISSYRKRRTQRGPILLYSAIGLVVIGAIAIAMYFMGGEGSSPLGGLFATPTYTPTLTFTPTSTSTPTLTATVTETPTITFTPTPSGPFPYTIIEGDTLQGIAEKFNLGDDGVLLLLDYNPLILENNGVYFLGQVLTIPPPGTTRPTSTPIPADIKSGTRIEYRVLPGDTLAGIAAKFNSLEENIITVNSIADANALAVGDVLEIPVNLVTPTATLPPTSTPVTPTIEGQPAQAAATATPAPGNAAAPCDLSTNEEFVSELATLINNARKNAGLAALQENETLTSAANVHVVDMICNNYLSQNSLEGTTPEERVADEGYAASIVLQSIYALPPAYGINAQAAFNWWINDPENRAKLLSADVIEFGIAYAESEESLLGGYFVLVSAKP